MKKLGSINPCSIAYLYDKKGHTLGTTLDTPNAIAYAMAINPNVAYAKAYYRMFGDTIKYRDDLSDRFKGVMWDMVILSSYLTWHECE